MLDERGQLALGLEAERMRPVVVEVEVHGQRVARLRVAVVDLGVLREVELEVDAGVLVLVVRALLLQRVVRASAEVVAELGARRGGLPPHPEVEVVAHGRSPFTWSKPGPRARPASGPSIVTSPGVPATTRPIWTKPSTCPGAATSSA